MKHGLGNRVRALREEYRMSQTEFAGHIGISYVALANIEKGKTETPQTETINNMVGKFGTTLDWLIKGKGEMLPNGPRDTETINGNPDSPWKDEAWSMAKQQLEKKDATIDRLSISFDRLTELMSRLDPSAFLHPVKETA